jgi:hypothetical protein
MFATSEDAAEHVRREEASARKLIECHLPRVLTQLVCAYAIASPTHVCAKYRVKTQPGRLNGKFKIHALSVTTSALTGMLAHVSTHTTLSPIRSIRGDMTGMRTSIRDRAVVETADPSLNPDYATTRTSSSPTPCIDVHKALVIFQCLGGFNTRDVNNLPRLTLDDATTAADAASKLHLSNLLRSHPVMQAEVKANRTIRVFVGLTYTTQRAPRLYMGMSDLLMCPISDVSILVRATLTADSTYAELFATLDDACPVVRRYRRSDCPFPVHLELMENIRSELSKHNFPQFASFFATNDVRPDDALLLCSFPQYGM